MRGLGLAWIIVLSVVVVTAAVKPLREQVRLQAGVAPWDYGPMGFIYFATYTEDSVGDPEVKWPRPYRARAREFVEREHADDAEMLMAAGLLLGGGGTTTGRSFLRRAVDAGGGPPAHAAYADALLQALPDYERPATRREDPEEPELPDPPDDGAGMLGEDAGSTTSPQALDPDATGPVLQQLHAWQRADPENAFPLALETYVLYGLHRDTEALACWDGAGTSSAARDYRRESARAVSRLLVALGAPEPEAACWSWGVGRRGNYWTGRLLGAGAHAARYEGRIAQLEGRPAEAIHWWHRTVDLGGTLQESSETTNEFLLGASIEKIGSAPIWKWYADRATATPDGPLLGGRIWHGPEHDFYREHAGAAADEQLRASLLMAKARTGLLRQRARASSDEFCRDYWSLGRGRALAGQLGLLALLLAAVGTWRRRAAYQATVPRPFWRVVIALASLSVPLAVNTIIWGRFNRGWGMQSAVPVWYVEFINRLEGVALFLPLAFALFLTAIATPRTRRPGARLLTAWRSNLLHVLPVTLALGALLYLALGLASAQGRHNALQRELWEHPRDSQMARLTRSLGEAWDSPTIPPDSWRDEQPILDRDRVVSNNSSALQNARRVLVGVQE